MRGFYCYVYNDSGKCRDVERLEWLMIRSSQKGHVARCFKVITILSQFLGNFERVCFFIGIIVLFVMVYCVVLCLTRP